jgi:hypothetical protein
MSEISNAERVFISIHKVLTNQAKNITTPFTRYALDLFIPAMSRYLHKTKLSITVDHNAWPLN